MNVARLLAPGSDWDWTVGAAYRHHRYARLGEVRQGDGVDIGSSARYQYRLPNTRWIASAAGVMRNVGDSDMLPYDTRLGLAVSCVVTGEQGHDLMALTFAYVLDDDRRDSAYFGGRRLGIELTLLAVLSFRVGHDEQMFGGSSQYGIGLAVPRQWLEPVGIVIDWGSMGMGDNLFGETSRSMIAVTGILDL